MLYITGDTHIPVDILKLNSKRFPDQKDLWKEDFVIICGDFSGVWNNDNEELYWRKWLEQKRFTTLFIDGNHENFNLLNEFEIEGKRIFTFGGASSHDKEYRTKDKNWWEEELPSEQELETAISNLEANGWNVDYVITHCAPSSVQEEISFNYSRDILTEFFEEIKKKAKFDKWFFGHYHVDVEIDDKFCCVFNNIKKLV